MSWSGSLRERLSAPCSRPKPRRWLRQWLADHLQVAGRLGLDAGAAKALRSEASLRRSGSRAWRANSSAAGGRLPPPEGAEIARGLVNYNAQESRRIAGRASNEIEAILGYIDEPELIHRDNLVLL